MKKATQLSLAFLFLFSISNQLWGQSSAQEMPERYIEVTYEDATVYTGKTEYSFKRDNGSLFGIAFSNLDEYKEWNPVMPENMLESGAGIDGVPGPNPSLVGKTFLLIFGETGDRVMEVRLKE